MLCDGWVSGVAVCGGKGEVERSCDGWKCWFSKSRGSLGDISDGVYI